MSSSIHLQYLYLSLPNSQGCGEEQENKGHIFSIPENRHLVICNKRASVL